MKHMFKKILSSFFIMILLLTTIPFTASAETYSGTCGDSLTWAFDESTGELVISGTGEMNNYDLRFEFRPWSDYQNHITKVIIGDGVTSIGEYAFKYCVFLTDVELGNTVTTIGEGAFYFCEMLGYLNIPESVTTIESKAFFKCCNMGSVYIPENVTEIGPGAFAGCVDADGKIGSLKKIFVNENNQYYCNDSNGVLYNKDKTILVQCPAGYDEYNFQIPSSVTTVLDYAFFFCTEISRITIPDSVKYIGSYAFAYCYALFDISISDNITDIGQYAFHQTQYYNESDNWTSDALYIGKYLIEAMSSISGTYTIVDGTKVIASSAFSKNSNLTEVTIPDSVITIGDSAFSNCKKIENITLPDSITTIGNASFQDCTGLTSLIIPNSVVTIKDSAFSGCHNITTIDIGDNVTSIGNFAFSDCRSLTSIIISDKVNAIGDLSFANCTQLSDVTIGNGIKTISYGTFSNCPNIKEITIPENVTVIEDFAFDFCSNLKNIVISKNVTTIGEGVFVGCFSLENINVDPENQYYCSDSYGTLYNKNRTLLIHYPAKNPSVDFLVPEGVKFIGLGAFAGATNLTKITIPRSVTYIGYYAFQNNYALTDIYFNGTESQWSNIVIDSSNDSLANLTIHFIEEDDDHIHSYTSSITKNATCKEVGVLTYSCSCGDNYTTIIKKSDHSWKNWVVTKVATVEVEGEMQRSCSVCDETETQTLPKLQPSKVNSVDIGNISMNYKDSTIITPAINADNGVKYTVTYFSSDPSVATVDEGGNVYASGKGSAEITCTVTDEYGNAVTDTCEIEVKYSWWQWIIVIVLFGWIWY
ncbi:MAG: leucine-rich repeat protein [Clostridia bacterium]|nr:leucine-rich repeat protein [Clostridia bacterium]